MHAARARVIGTSTRSRECAKRRCSSARSDSGSVRLSASPTPSPATVQRGNGGTFAGDYHRMKGQNLPNARGRVPPRTSGWSGVPFRLGRHRRFRVRRQAAGVIHFGRQGRRHARAGCRRAVAYLAQQPLRCPTGDPIALLGTAGEAVGYDPAQIRVRPPATAQPLQRVWPRLSRQRPGEERSLHALRRRPAPRSRVLARGCARSCRESSHPRGTRRRRDTRRTDHRTSGAATTVP